MKMNGIDPTIAQDACGLLTIDLGALCDNYRQLSERVFPGTAAAVVKADAYGLGANRLSQTLYEAGCRVFFVAHFIEAVRLRPALPADATIYVLNGLQPGTEQRAADLAILPVINSLEQLANWSRTADERGDHLAAALQVDTGMSRLGLSPEELEVLAGAPSLLSSSVTLTHVVSHLACADQPDAAANGQQLSVLRRLSDLFPGIPLSFANSGGVFLGTDYHTALARPGIALYGGAPTAAARNPMKPVVRLAVPVIQTRTVQAGARVGYGGAYIAQKETRLATISAGYADGLPRHLSDSGAAYYGDVRLPFVGRVSMDSLTIDVTALEPGTLALGSMVELIGEHQSLEQVAEAAGTISYEILTRLGQRYQRQYVQP